jgi:hypothetical protein
MKKGILLLFFAISSFVVLNAQDKLSDLTVIMEIVKVEADDPNMAMQLEMMKGSKTEMLIKGKKTMTKMDMMGGMIKMNILADTDSDNMDMTMDAMGQKFWINTKPSDSKTDPKQKAVLDGAEIIVDKNVKKTIAGYECYLVKISSKETPDMKYETYVTEKIISNSGMLQGFQGLELPGFPLEFTVTNPMMKLTSSTKEIKTSVDESKMIIKTDGFKKMSMEEFRQSMGGGFGF